ncbi:uncharacterized protein LOC120661932 isoform X3 [Panicum virgatum]|uniref:uncharacterized protein LOC120661932 isoform X3 n=1 Tax=Panicum virgatum TaxID=38727 RepID=UPI0019D5F3BB|nr:uncharacterized protein LOC120661932 isoform X3 [Panicum virgatum]
MALGNRMAKPRGRPPWRCRLQRQGGSRQLHIREQTRGRDARRRLRKALSRIRRPWRPDPCPPAPDAGRRRRRGGGPVRWRLPEFAPAKVLDFGAEPSSVLWCLQATRLPFWAFHCCGHYLIR